jgi:hypothetical protein
LTVLLHCMAIRQSARRVPRVRKPRVRHRRVP